MTKGGRGRRSLRFPDFRPAAALLSQRGGWQRPPAQPSDRDPARRGRGCPSPVPLGGLAAAMSELDDMVERKEHPKRVIFCSC